MPSVRKRFKTFHEFASASLEDIYGDKLDKSYHIHANHLESGVWINQLDQDGNIHFKWRPFPRFAQIAPIYGTVVSDFNLDGHPDIYAIQNSYSTQPETGWWRNGLSQLLYGQGDGTFRCVPTNQSGLVVADDGKAVTLVDLNNDHFPDIVATQNNGPTKTFIRRNNGKDKPYVLTVSSQAAGFSNIGSKIVIEYQDDTKSHHEIQSASGYLTQHSPKLYISSKNHIKKVSVQWPNGDVSHHHPQAGQRRIQLTHKPQ